MQILCGSDFRVYNEADVQEIVRVPDTTAALRDGAIGAVCTNSINGYVPAASKANTQQGGSI
jgi:hypothetical protein